MSDARKNLKSYVALVGAPNSGKTTLYNWLTNSKFKTVNYPGATVDYMIGDSNPEFGPQVTIVDTPGVYSLFPKSADEEVTKKVIFESLNEGIVNKVILVVDGTQLERHLIVAEQLKEAQASMVIVVTMKDLLEHNEIRLDFKKLSESYQCPVILFNGNSGFGAIDVIHSLTAIENKTVIEFKKWDDETTQLKTKKIRDLSAEIIISKNKPQIVYDHTSKIDKLILNPFMGGGIFFGIMTLLFTSIYSLSGPFTDFIDWGFSTFADKVLSINEHSIFLKFISEGVIASFGSVAVFIPQIFILFFGIGVLESTGYLARAATIIDRPFSKLGLSGRSFIPILSGFACAVPSIMATRNIPSKRERLITTMVIPLMVCSARLPVYALLLGFLFIHETAWKAGFFLAVIYIASLMIGYFASGILNKFITKSKNSYFMLELPLYRMPQFDDLFRQAISKTKSYIVKAGPMIFIFAVIIWLGTTFPNYQTENKTERVQTSYLAEVGQRTEPIFKPMGLDWRVGVGLLSAFAAREVFVSTLAVVFNITDDNEDSQQESLIKSMQNAKNSSGEKIFTTASVIGLIIYFMIALQCISTFSITVREMGGLNYALIQLISYNVIAYILTVVIVQGLRSIGVA